MAACTDIINIQNGVKAFREPSCHTTFGFKNLITTHSFHKVSLTEPWNNSACHYRMCIIDT